MSDVKYITCPHFEIRPDGRPTPQGRIRGLIRLPGGATLILCHDCNVAVEHAASTKIVKDLVNATEKFEAVMRHQSEMFEAQFRSVRIK